MGQRWIGLCPFHSEKSPSFSVNAVDGLYHCFGCKASGDAITFVREMEHLDFVGAVELLAGKAGVAAALHRARRGREPQADQTRLLEVTERARDWYHDRLSHRSRRGGGPGLPPPPGVRCASRSRQYRVGWAPDGWDLLVRRSGRSPGRHRGVPGSGSRTGASRMQDFFRARILFPIFDERSRVIGFGGRKLPDADGPKYQNSRDNDLYKKSRALYAINWAKAEAVAVERGA